MDDDLRRKRNEFITRSFRDLADCDYISARVLHRLKLYNQFSWAALQAIEKYLKTIILFYDGNTKDLKHDLVKGLDRVEKINDIKWDFDDTIHKFIDYLNTYGGDRYFSFPRFTKGNECIVLDYSVWKIRRYCQDFYFFKRDYPAEYERLIKWIQSKKCEEKANKYRLMTRGYLEELFKGKSNLRLRSELVYKNFYYGGNKKHRIKIPIIITSSSPTHFHFPELVNWLKPKVKMPKEVIAYLENENIKRTKLRP